MKYKIALPVKDESEDMDSAAELKQDLDETLDQLNQIGARVTHLIVCAETEDDDS